MGFFQLDDKVWAGPKFELLLEQVGPARAAEAMGVWSLAGARCRHSGFDGLISESMLVRIWGDRRTVRRAALALVGVRFWHGPGHDCDRCPQPEKGSWVFHQWFQFRYPTGEAEKVAVAKRKELRDEAIVEAVWARDTDPATGKTPCRYCAREVVRPRHGGNRKTDLLGTLDHVDPALADGARNLVVACSECNQRKGNRPPERAGMALRPAPTPLVENAVQDHGSSYDGVPPAGAPAGAGLAGTGAGSGVGVGGAGSGVGRAGAPPQTGVPEAGYGGGSPWKGHHGRAPAQHLIDEATCRTHHEPRPCRRCQQDPTP